jgi:hypothetical protein
VVTTALVMTALGIVSVGIGTLGLRGRLARVPSTTLVRNYAAQVLLGGGLVGMSLIGLLEGHVALVALLTLPTLALMGLGFYTALVRPPRWLQPQWQRDLPVPGRRPRR